MFYLLYSFWFDSLGSAKQFKDKVQPTYDASATFLLYMGIINSCD